jgi:hypothetical protein
VLDADEDSLVPRLLYAALLRAANQPALALVQYETLLPLAVGQGDFLRAFAVQRHLDVLHPASVSHARRFEALQRWFTTLRQRGANDSGLRRAQDVTLASLLQMEPPDFTRMAETSSIESLEPDARTLEGELGTVRFVLFGRARWVITRGDATVAEGIAQAGDAIAVNDDAGEGTRLRIEAEWPTEFMYLCREAVALIVDPDGTRDQVAAPPETAPAAALEAEFAMPPEAPAPAEAAPPAAAPPAPGEPRPRVERPQPDPRFEPTIAVSAPVARRRETRISVNVKSGIARIGLEDTRVAPLDGRMLQFRPEKIELGFPRSELRHIRERLERSFVGLRLTLDGRTAVGCVSRVLSISSPAAKGEADEMRIELEFMPMPARDQEKITEAANRAPSTPARPAA